MLDREWPLPREPHQDPLERTNQERKHQHSSRHPQLVHSLRDHVGRVSAGPSCQPDLETISPEYQHGLPYVAV